MNRLILIIFCATNCTNLFADQLKENLDIRTSISVPNQIPPPKLSTLKVPENFEITKIIEGYGNLRILAVHSNGNIYATRREEGDVSLFKLDKEGKLVDEPIVVARRAGMHGITFFQDKAYMVTAHEIFVADVKENGMFGPLQMLVHDLPAAGQHNNRTISVGPDAMLYVSVGSTCNICNESSPENATLLKFSLDGKKRLIFASGLRNTIGFDWHPLTGQLWGMDHGIDWHGNDVMPEELNLIENGKRYGWPYLYANNKIVPRLEPTGKVSKEEWKLKSQSSLMGYVSHAAPMQMAFYNNQQFPIEYRGDAFVAMHGSWNRDQPSGYEIVRIHYDNGRPVSIKPFLTGFLTNNGSTGRPVGMAVSKDGSLLFTDDQNGAIYRISYRSSNTYAKQTTAPSQEMESQALKGSGVPIAINRKETEINSVQTKNIINTLKITSLAFNNNERIPEIHSGYDQDSSFDLHWSDGPENTKSYVLIMEDPDSKKPPTPVVHWTAWNIPIQITSLPEGLQKQHRLLIPEGILQGPTSTGKIGYMGPKPPKSDKEHHYHIQVFAMDSILTIPVGSDRDQLLNAMSGHVIAKGEIIGTFERPIIPVKP